MDRRAGAAVPAAECGVHDAAFGGQRGALPTLREPWRCMNRRAVGAFPAANAVCTDAAFGNPRDASITPRVNPRIRAARRWAWRVHATAPTRTRSAPRARPG